MPRRTDDEDLDAVHDHATDEGGTRLAWSWATLTIAQRCELAERLDRFAGLYNRYWAVDGGGVPACWYRHTALAHDLAALAWAHHGAYRDPAATPELALRFQDHLVRFADRLERWLAPDPAACRAGAHPRRPGERRAPDGPEPDTLEKQDTVALLGAAGL